MGALIIVFLVIFFLLNYWCDKNDEIWKDENLKKIFPRSKKIHIKIFYMTGIFLLGVAMILEVNYKGKIPIVFLTIFIEDWLAVLFVIWNHKDNKKYIKAALIYGIISSLILIILYKFGKFNFEDILKD